MSERLSDELIRRYLKQRRCARLYLLPAKAKPVVCIIRRKPSRWFHVITWDSETDQFTHGSWFRGKLYPLRCDISFDGRCFVYLAMGSNGTTWNGLSVLPWLKTTDDAPNLGTWRGGGYWTDKKTLHINAWLYTGTPPRRAGPGQCYHVVPEHAAYGEDEGVLYPRMERDGWRRRGEFGQERILKNAAKYCVACDGDAGWEWQYSRKHPTLYCYYRGYFAHGRTFEFELPEHSDIVGPEVDWATWDALGQLIVARNGQVERYTLDDLATGRPGLKRSFEDLEPPRRSSDALP